MRYTQLDFAPYSPKRKTLEQQAGFLLRELVPGRVHKFPCDCGACIYWAYRQAPRAEGRTFSTRTFFVYFMRVDLFNATYVESLPVDYRKWKAEASRKRKDAWFADPQRLHEPPHSMVNAYHDSIREAARCRVLAMLKKLERAHRDPAVKEFLRGILNKKSFYTYYKRAGDPQLGRIVDGLRQRLSKDVTRAVEFMATFEEKNSIKGDKKTLPRKRRSFDRIPEHPRK